MGGDVFQQQAGGIVSGIEIPEEFKYPSVFRLLAEERQILVGQPGFTLRPRRVLRSSESRRQHCCRKQRQERHGAQSVKDG